MIISLVHLTGINNSDMVSLKIKLKYLKYEKKIVVKINIGLLIIMYHYVIVYTCIETYKHLGCVLSNVIEFS